MGWKTGAAILVLALAVRVVGCAWWESRLPPGSRFGFADSESYWVLATAIANGQPYQTDPLRRVFRTPGLPLLLAPLIAIGGEQTPVFYARLLNCLCGTVAVAGVMGLARMLFDGRAALLAGLATAVYPEAVAMSTFILAEGPFCPLMMAHLILWTVAARTSSQRTTIAASLGGGVIAGLATLVRPSWLLFTPFAAGLAILGGGERRMRHATIAACLMLGLVTAMAPWWIRNWQVTGTFVATTLQTGESLYDGLHPGASGASDMRFVDGFRRELQAEDAKAAASDATAAAQLAATLEQRLDRRMHDAAVRWTRENPQQALQLAAIKFGRIWNLWPNEPSLRSWPLRLAVAGSFTPLLLGGLCGAMKFARRGWPYVLCFLPAIYFTGLHMVFVGSIRYRQPAMLPLAVLAAGWVASNWVGVKKNAT